MPVLAISSNVPSPAGSGTPITTITKVGTTARSSQGGNLDSSARFTSLNVGDLVVVVAYASPQSGSTPIQPVAMSSVGATGWANAAGPSATVTVGGFPLCVSIWSGVVATPMSDTLTVAWPSNAAGGWFDIYQFSTGIPSNIWAVDVNGTNTNVSSTTITFPPLTPTGTGEVYVGGAASAQTPSAGSTAGFVYDIDTLTFINCYDVNVIAAAAPTATQSPAGVSANVAVLFRAFHPTSMTNTNSVTLGTVPTGRMWVVSQIGYEILPVTTATGITTSVTLNGRSVYTGSNGNGGSDQGPPYITVRVGDVMVVNWTAVPIGSSCVGNFFYNEYSANAQPSDIGGLV